MKYIQIKEPCKANWNKMQPVEGGRFCETCQKKVIDFSKWETSAIIQDLESRNEKICGRFRGDSIAKSSTLYSFAQSKNRIVFMIASILIFIVTSCRRPMINTGEPIKHGNDSLYNCLHKDPKSLDFSHKPNINDTTELKKDSSGNK